MLAQSFAKNFGLYGERVGTVSIVCQSSEQRAKVESQLKLIIRPMYSSPPIHGSSIVKEVLNSAELSDQYYSEVLKPRLDLPFPTCLASPSVRKPPLPSPSSATPLPA